MAANLLPNAATTNYSILALPVYYAWAVAPHMYAVAYVIRNHPDHKWDNLNPRRPELKEELSKVLTTQEYGRYERSEAAHYNSLEFFPLFASTVILANLARVPTSQLNNYILGIGALRVAHTFVYINTTNPTWTHFRSAIYMSVLGWSLTMLWRAGSALA